MQNRIGLGAGGDDSPVEIDNYLPAVSNTGDIDKPDPGGGRGDIDKPDPGGGEGQASQTITISIPITINPGAPTQITRPPSGNGKTVGSQFFERQTKSQWCWAAVALSLDHYFSPKSTWTQCAIARQVLHPAECWCGQPFTNEVCDRAAYLQAALKVVQRPYTAVPGALAFDRVQTEIDSARPVCARIQWRGGAGHFAIISGYRLLKSQTRQLMILDPLYGPSLQDDDAFRRGYRLSGQWTDTFLMH